MLKAATNSFFGYGTMVVGRTNSLMQLGNLVEGSGRKDLEFTERLGLH